MNPDDPQWHHVRTQEEWQQYYQNAIAALHQNHNDPEAMNALQYSTMALNAYDQEGVNQTKLSDIPHELGTVAHGIVSEAKGIPASLHQLVQDARSGQLNKVGSDIYQGAKTMGSNILAPSELALSELTSAAKTGDPSVSPEEFNTGLQKGGAAMTDLAGVRAAGLFKGESSGGSSGGLAGVARHLPGPIGKIARVMKATGDLPENMSENYALKNAMMKARLDQLKQNLDQKSTIQPDVTKTPGLRNQQLRLQIEKLQRQLDENGEDEAGPSGSAPVDPNTPPAKGPNDILNPRDQAKQDFKGIDPYGLDEITPKPPNDDLGNFIQHLKAKNGDPDPVSPLDRLGNPAPPPITPDALNDILKKPKK